MFHVATALLDLSKSNMAAIMGATEKHKIIFHDENIKTCQHLEDSQQDGEENISNITRMNPPFLLLE